jgi:hypothetical protein
MLRTERERLLREKLQGIQFQQFSLPAQVHAQDEEEADDES